MAASEQGGVDSFPSTPLLCSVVLGSLRRLGVLDGAGRCYLGGVLCEDAACGRKHPLPIVSNGLEYGGGVNEGRLKESNE